MKSVVYPKNTPRLRLGDFRRKSIPARDNLAGKSMSAWWTIHLSTLGLWETMHVSHWQTHAQAVASVNYSGGILFRRFKTAEVSPGVIAIWRFE